MRMPRFSLLLGTALAFAPADGAVITIAYNNAPPEAQAAIAHAAGIWESILVSPVPIKAMVTWFPMGGAALGITFPNGRKDFTGAPVPQTWYATSLANSIAQQELNPGENDFEIWLDANASWYFGTDGDVPLGQQDLVSVALHEMGHGLGFVGLSKKEGTTGSFGLLLASDFAPLVTTFPWPQLDTLPGIFDRFLSHPLNGPLELMDNPGTALGSAMTSNQLRFNGALALEANGGDGPRIYAPAAFALGSSCVHLNEGTYPVGNANELMTPFSAVGHANHWPGPLCLAILQDIGWTLAPDVGIAEHHARTGTLDLWPNPAHAELHVGTSAYSSVIIGDMAGRPLLRAQGVSPIDISGLVPGPYIVTAQRDGLTMRGRLIKE